MSEAVKAAYKRFGKNKVFTELMHSAVGGVYLRTEDWIEDDPHPNFPCQLIDLFEHCSVCVMCACTAVRLYLTSFSSIKTQSRCCLFLPFRMVLPGGSRPGAPHHQCHPEKRQAEALDRRALAGREAHLGANHPETLASMNNLALLLRQQGKLAEAGLRSLG